jgi:murein DD-endopeptidase
MINVKALLAILTWAALLSFGAGTEALPRNQPALGARVNSKPGVVRINGKYVTYYEIGLQNNSQADLSLKKLVVTYGRSGRQLITLSGQQLRSRLAGSALLKPKQTAWLYLELTLPAAAGKASKLNHVISYSVADTVYQSRLQVDVASLPPIVVGAPLGGGNWAAVYSPEWERGHRRVFFTINKQARIPGRYAIDFIRLDKQGHQAMGNEDSIKNWRGYAADVLAVADGRIVSAVDIYKESETVSGHPAVDSTRAAGNYIALKIRDSVFAFYEHLKPGSIRVKPGDFVKKGQIIGRLGFTGQSTGPHLHFHLANDSTPLGAEGIPYVFDVFTYKGFYKDFGSFGKNRWSDAPGAAVPRQHERPISNTVIEFGGRQGHR